MYFWYDHLDSTIFSKFTKPNGYTLLAALQGPLIINPLQVKVDYTFNDFEPLVQLVSAPQIMVADVWWGIAALKCTLEPVNAIVVETFEKIANNKLFKGMMKKMVSRIPHCRIQCRSPYFQSALERCCSRGNAAGSKMGTATRVITTFIILVAYDYLIDTFGYLC